MPPLTPPAEHSSENSKHNDSVREADEEEEDDEEDIHVLAQPAEKPHNPQHHVSRIQLAAALADLSSSHTHQHDHDHDHNYDHDHDHDHDHDAGRVEHQRHSSNAAAAQARPHYKRHKRKDSDVISPMVPPPESVRRQDHSSVVLLEAPANAILVDGSYRSSASSPAPPGAATAASTDAPSAASTSIIKMETPMSPTMHRRHSNPSSSSKHAHSNGSKSSIAAATHPGVGVSGVAASSSSLQPTAPVLVAGATASTTKAHSHALRRQSSSSSSTQSQARSAAPSAGTKRGAFAAAVQTVPAVWIWLVALISSLAPTGNKNNNSSSSATTRSSPRDSDAGDVASGSPSGTTSRHRHVHSKQQQQQQRRRGARSSVAKVLDHPFIPRAYRRRLLALVGIVAAFLLMQVFLYSTMSSSCSATNGSDEMDGSNVDMGGGGGGVNAFDGMVRPPIVEYYIHGHGRGHASRGKTVVEALERIGYKVCVFVDEHVEGLVKSVGTETVSVKSLPIANSVNTVWETLKVFLFRYLTDADCSICDRTKHSPDLVISDGDFPGVWRASRAGIPAVALGHGYLFSTTEKPEHVSDYAWGHQKVLNGRTTGLAQCTVDVSFVPLTPLDANRTVVAKPRLRDAILRTKRVPPTKKMVVVYFRDHGSGQRIFEELNASGYEVRAFGPEKLDTPYVHVRAFDEQDFITSMSEASAVIATSGDNLIAECMWLGIPLMAVYDAADSEQMLNAEMFERTGLGVASSFQSFTPQRLQHFLSQLPVFEAKAQEGMLRTWEAPDTIDAALQCIQKVSPIARRWHDFAGGADAELTPSHRRHLSQIARAI